MKTRLLVVALVLLLGASAGASYALTTFYKAVSGIGNVDYTGQVDFTDLHVASSSKVTVDLTSNAGTVPAYVYTVKLYENGTQIGTPQPISWTAGQIPGTKKTVSFTGLSLAAATNLGAEITQ